MTCIIGLVDKDNVWMGVDTFGSDGYVGVERTDRKMFVPEGVNHALISYITSFRMGQILMYEEDLFKELDVIKRRIDHKYMVKKFIPKVQKAFEKGGFGKEKDGEKEGGCFLVAYKGMLFDIAEDYQVGICSSGYVADGCGSEFALGSLATTEEMIMKPKDRILAALRAAAMYSVGVSGPFFISNTKRCKFDRIDE